MSIFDDDFLGDMFDFDGDGKTSIDEEFLAYKMFEESFKDDENDDYDDFEELEDDLDAINYSDYTNSNSYKKPSDFSAENQYAKSTFNSNETPKIPPSVHRAYKRICIAFIIFSILYCIGSCGQSKSNTYSTYSSSTRSHRITTTTQKNTYTTTTKAKTTTTTTKKSKKTTTTTKDPYNAKSYDHPEDFYEDYYDDFWDFEDAEDYYYDHQ